MQPSWDMVKMHKTVDVTKAREIPMMGKDAFSAGIDHFELLMMGAPFPEAKLSISQTTALLEQLRNGTCYVVFALWGCYYIRTAKAWGAEN